MVVWSDDDFSDESDNEEEVNMCLMVRDSEVLFSFFFCFKFELFEIIIEFMDGMKELFDKM